MLGAAAMPGAGIAGVAGTTHVDSSVRATAITAGAGTGGGTVSPGRSARNGNCAGGTPVTASVLGLASGTIAAAAAAAAGRRLVARDAEGFGARDAEGFGARDAEGFGARDAEGFGARDAEGFGARDAEGFGERDAEGFGARDAEGFGARDTKGVGARDADGVGARETDGLGARDTDGIGAGPLATGCSTLACCNGFAAGVTADSAAATCSGTITTRRSGNSDRRSCQGKTKPGSQGPWPPKVRFNSNAWNSSESSSAWARRLCSGLMR